MKLWKYAYLLNHDEQLKIETFVYALKHSLHKIPLENVRVIDKSEDKIKMKTVLAFAYIFGDKIFVRGKNKFFLLVAYLIVDMICRKVQVVTNIGCQFKIDRRQGPNIVPIYTVHIEMWWKSAKAQGNCHYFKRKVWQHVSSSTTSPDNWRAGDSRQLTGDRRPVVVWWGFGGRRPILLLSSIRCIIISWV